MKLLAVDTATEACSAALMIDGEVHLQYQLAPREHARLILPMIDQLLAEAAIRPAALDGLVLGRGPGSFTGVRIAAAAVQGIALVADLPVVPVSSLAAIAQRAWREHEIDYCIAMIDARMDQIYWACFESTGCGHTRALGPEAVSDPAALSPESLPELSGIGSSCGQWVAVGSGMQAYHTRIALPDLGDGGLTEPLFPSALDMLHLAAPEFQAGNTVSAMDAVPSYLRDNVALTEQQRAEAARQSDSE